MTHDFELVSRLTTTMKKIDPVPDNEHWCRHLLTPEECMHNERGPFLNPKIFENLFRRSRKKQPERETPPGISGRLLSIARGTLRENGEATIEDQLSRKNRNAENWEFHGILSCQVGVLRNLSDTVKCDVEHAPIKGNYAHANLMSIASMFKDEALTVDSIEALERIGFVSAKSDEFLKLDQAEVEGQDLEVSK